jgi:hypothetical protein
MTLVWSFGGGVQSWALAVLVAQGRLPRPDYTVIANTKREATETWEYLCANAERVGVSGNAGTGAR